MFSRGFLNEPLIINCSIISNSSVPRPTLVMTCSAVVLALQCRTVIEVFTRFAPPRPRPLARATTSDENACRMIMSLPQPSGPTRMNGSLFSIHGSIILRVRLRNVCRCCSRVGQPGVPKRWAWLQKQIFSWAIPHSELCLTICWFG